MNKQWYQWAARKGFLQGCGVCLQSPPHCLPVFGDGGGMSEEGAPSASQREAEQPSDMHLLQPGHPPRLRHSSFCCFQGKFTNDPQSVNKLAFTKENL